MASGEILHITSEPTRDSAPTPLDNFFGATQPGANFATEINPRSGMIREEGLPYVNGRSPFEPALPIKQPSTAFLSSEPTLRDETSVVDTTPDLRPDLRIVEGTDTRQDTATTPKRRVKNTPNWARRAAAAGVLGVAQLFTPQASAPTEAAGILVTGGTGGDLCEDPTVKAYFKKYPYLAAKDQPPTPTSITTDVQLASTTDVVQPPVDLVTVRLKTGDGGQMTVTIPPCPAPEKSAKEWPYKTPAEAVKAWNSGKLKIKTVDRWLWQGHYQPYGNESVDQIPKEIYCAYTAKLLFISILDGGKEVELLVGMEGRIKPGSPSNSNGSLRRERFTATIRVSSGIDDYAALTEATSLDSDAFGRLGDGDTTTRDILPRLKGREGANMVLYIEDVYDGDWPSPVDEPVNKAREHQIPAADDLYRFSWDATNGKSINKLKKPPFVNTPPGTVNPGNLPLVTFLFIQKE